MKNLAILVFVVALALTARATSLDDKIKSFVDAEKASDAGKSEANSMMAGRMPFTAAGFGSTALLPGGEAAMETMVQQILASNPDKAVQATGNALIAELEARKKAHEDAMTAQVNAVLSRVPNVLLKAEKTQDLDGLLADLQKAQSAHEYGYGPYGSDQVLQGLTNQLSSAYRFVAQWQDYLSERNSGNIEEAKRTLQSLSNSNQATLMARSEILARIDGLAKSEKQKPAEAPAGTTTEADDTPILDGIKTLDDLEPALKKLRALPNHRMDYDFSQLNQLASLYEEAKSGLPVTLDFSSSNYSNGNSGPWFGRLKSMLILYVLPRSIGSGALTPSPNETVADYLKRSIDAAEAKQDWLSLQRIIETQISVTSTRIPTYPSGAHSFLAGLNQEMAGQYAQAVTSYQTALSQPDDYLPSKVIGDRLDTMKKDHPAEYEEGMKNFLNPPRPAYVNPYMMMRPGMPGYGYPPTNYPTSVVMPGASPAPTATPGPITNAPAPIAPTMPPASTNAAPTPTPAAK